MIASGLIKDVVVCVLLFCNPHRSGLVGFAVSGLHQQTCVERIKANNGYVAYEGHCLAVHIDRFAWRVCGLDTSDFLLSARSIGLGGRPTPKQLAAICRAASQLESIRTVQLRACPLNDHHLRDLSKLSALEYVDIGFTAVTDAGIRHLRNHRSLKVLDLTTNTRITDKGIAELKQLKDLKILVLSGTRISNAGLVHLKRLPALEYLAIDGTRIKTTSAQLLKMFPNVGSIAFD